MATNVSGWSKALYDVSVEEYAKEHAQMVAGHPLFDKDFDRAKYDSAYEDFLAKVDTPEKLMQFAERLTPPPCPECGR